MTRAAVVLGLWLFTLPLAAQAPTVVRGTVRDTAARPLAGALVMASYATAAARTDSAGRYQLGPLPTGAVVVTARLLGYRPARDSVRLAPGDTARLDFTLTPSPLDIPGVVVTAGKRSQLVEEAATSVAVVEQADIARRAVNTVDEVVDRAPGVQFLDGQINIRGSTGYSRGLGSRVLLLVDGVPANQGDRGGINWDLLPVDQIERVEIVKGAGSALYGSAALGGVVNLITRDIATGLHWRLRATGGVYAGPPHAVWRFREGTAAHGGADLAVAYGTERLRGRLASGARHLDGYREQSAADHWQMAGRGQWLDPSGRHRVDVSGAWAVDDYQVPLVWCVAGQCDDRGQAYQPFRIDTTIRGEHTNSRKGYVTASFERTTSPALTWNARASWLRTDFTDARRTHADFSVADRFGGEVRVLSRRADHQTVIAGIEGAWSEVESDIFSGADSLDVAGTHTQREYAAYGESEIPIGAARLTVGTRIDFLAVDGGAVTGVVSPRLGIVVTTPAGAWRASAGRGFRAAALAERFVTTVVGPFRVVPNPALRSETAWAFEAGHTAALGGHVLLDAAVFWTETEDLIEPTLVELVGNDTARVIQFQNLTRARLRGVDVSLTAGWLEGRLRASAAYLYLDARELTRDALPERPLPFRPDHLLTLASDVAVLPRLTAGAEFRYASRLERVDLFEEDERVPTSVMDLRAGWDGGPLAVRLLLNNVFNYLYNQVPRTLAPVRTLSVVVTWTR